MTLVDAEGRLFGRWNFVDAVVVVLALGLIPIGYAAYMLFRTPPPALTAIEPAALVEGPNQRVTIRGINLRPYLRVSFNTTQGATFLFEDSSKAVVDLHAMPPGTYDVILYDFGQERHRLPGALTIRPAASAFPTTEVLAAGRFLNLSKESASELRPGLSFSDRGEILELGQSRPSAPHVFLGGAAAELPNPALLEVPALVKLSCVIKTSGGYPECGGADYVLRPNFILQLPRTIGSPAPFQVDQLRSTEPARTITVRARLAGPAETLAMVAVGDRDADLAANEFALGATIKALAPVTGVGGQAERMTTLEVRAQRLSTGWWQGVDTLRPSTQYMFRTPKYAVLTTVLAVDDTPRP